MILRIALASRELYPLSGGGIGQFVNSVATLLSAQAEVTILTSSHGQATYRELRERGDPRLPPAAVRVAFVDEPSPAQAEVWTCLMHAYSARVYERLRELYADRAPDLVEFPDYLGEGFVTLQAAEARDPFLRDTQVCVRLHTSAEMCQVLNGRLPADVAAAAMNAMERFSLARADRLIWQGGEILEMYRRFYGACALAQGARIRYPYRGPRGDVELDRTRQPRRELRVLYPGRLERRKGVSALVRAATALERRDFTLRLLGADTPTGPLGVSVQGLLEQQVAGDDRIEIRTGGPAGGVDRETVTEAIRSSDLVVIPSLWECWPYTALEALHLNRPVLTTPVGGLLELVKPGVSGWRSEGTGWRELAHALEHVLENRESLEQLIRDGAPVAHGEALADGDEIVDAYRRLIGGDPHPDRRTSPRLRAAKGTEPVLPLVSAIVPYYRASRFVRETVDSLVAQTYPRMEIVLVNDGSFEPADWVVAELSARLPLVVVSQMNAGLGAARNFGVLQSRGRYVFPLDADNLAEPQFVARCVDILEARPDAAYVTAWSRYIDERGVARVDGDVGYEPFGNYALELNARCNVAGDAAAVIRRRHFDAGFRYSEELTSFEDWHFYRELGAAGHTGIVIPERLLGYRVRGDSMQAQIAHPYRARLEEEINALIRQNGLQWTSSSG